MLGCIPALGIIPDGVNTGWYALEGDYVNVALSGAACIPYVGEAAGGGKLVAKAVSKYGDNVAKGTKTVIKGGTASKWVDDAGKTIWPPNNGAVAGTEKMINLNKGTTFGRIGGDTGSFVAPPKTSPDKLSLAPGTDISNYKEYAVLKPIPGVEKATVAPWFDKSGGGTQFKLPMTIGDLISEGYIVPK